MRLLVRLIMGIRRPRGQVLGQEFAGVIEAVGPRVERFRVGDRVFGTTGFGFGAYAEYICRPEVSPDGALAIKPETISFEEAATIPTGGLEALHYLRRAGDLRGKKLLVVGAGGGIGTLAVQLAMSLGAEVTGVDRLDRLGLVRRLGAARVIDYVREDFTKGSDTYDVLLDVVGCTPFSPSLRVIVPGGFYLIANPRLTTLLRAPWGWARKGRKVIARRSSPEPGDLDYLKGLVEEGKLSSPIDRRYPLEELRKAHGRVDSGLAVGRVAVTL